MFILKIFNELLNGGCKLLNIKQKQELLFFTPVNRVFCIRQQA